MTPDEYADLAESMVPVACDLACRVRDGDAEGITRMAEARGWDTQTKALLVVLAAMVPDAGHVGDLLAWTENLETILAWKAAQLPLAASCEEDARKARHRRQSREAMARMRARRAAAGDDGQRQGEAA